MAFLPASGLCALISICFVVRGLKVDLYFLFIPLALFFLLFAGMFLRGKYNIERAAAFADEHYKLNNALLSMLEFRKSQRSPFHSLHIKKTASECRQLSLDKINLHFPLKTFSAAIALSLLSACLCAMPESQAEAKNGGEDIKICSEKINKKLKDELEQIKKELTEKEKKFLEKSKLSQRINALKKTGSKKEALRQYAELEKLIGGMREKAKLKINEKLLAKIAEELKKNKSTKSIGESFQQKKYSEAAQNLETLKNEINKASKTNKVEKLKRLLNKLKKLSKNIRKATQGEKCKSSELSDSAKRFCDSCDKLTKSMKDSKSEKSRLDTEDMDKALKKFLAAIKEHNAKKGFFAKMDTMKQAFLAAQCMMAGDSKDPKKGIGASEDNNPDKTFNTATKKNGYISNIQGKKGLGPSEAQTEDAVSGSGASRLKKTKAGSDYKIQVESFVKRDDIPESMKSGVKTYFSIIHKLPNHKAGDSK